MSIFWDLYKSPSSVILSAFPAFRQRTGKRQSPAQLIKKKKSLLCEGFSFFIPDIAL